jgi:hypothetical protein
MPDTGIRPRFNGYKSPIADEIRDLNPARHLGLVGHSVAPTRGLSLSSYPHGKLTSGFMHQRRAVSTHTAQPLVLSSLGLPADHRSEYARPPVATGLSGSLGDRSESSGRENHLGRRAGTTVESKEHSSATGAGRGGLQCAFVGQFGGIRCHSEPSLSAPAEVA